jgi:sugar phosphate isomerase/epimerase
MDAFGLLERAATLGVEVLQIADNLPVDALPAPDIDRLGTAAQRAGLALELGTRGVEPSHLARFLDLACCLKVRLVRTITYTDGHALTLAQVEAWLREALPSYERAGVTLALENYEEHTSEELAGLVRRIGSPCLGICLDTVNSLGALETPAEVVHILSPLTVNVHVKDFSIARIPSRMGYLVTGRPAGAGCIDIPWLIGQVRQCGREPNVIVEQWPPFSNTLSATIALEAAWAEQSVRYLQRCLCGVERITVHALVITDWCAPALTPGARRWANGFR